MDWQASKERSTFRLLGLSLGGALLVVLLLLGYQIWLSYYAHIAHAELVTRDAVALMEARLDSTLRRTDAHLRALVRDIPPEAMRQSAVGRYADKINADLDSRLFNLEEMAGYRVHDAFGDTLYSSDSARVQKVNIADRAYFAELRDHPAAGLVFSEVVVGRSSRRPLVVIARAIRDRDGRFLGVVFGLLQVDHLQRLFRNADLGEGSVLALRRSDDHRLVLRQPELPQSVNVPLRAEHPGVQALAEERKNFNHHLRAHSDGVDRIFAVRVMTDYPFYFLAGVSRQQALSGWYSNLLGMSFSVFVLLSLIALLFHRLWFMRKRELGILKNLGKSESQFRTLARIVPVGICHTSPQGRITYANERYLEILGRRRHEVIGAGWFDFLHPDDRGVISTAWEARRRDGDVFGYEHRFLRPDGGVVFVFGQTTTDRGVDGEVLGYVSALTDITDRKQGEADLLVAKQAAEKANLSKTRFLAAASHDLRQPIQAINLFLDALRRTPLSEEQQVVTAYLSRSVTSLGELLYSLLDVSRLDAGMIRPEWREVGAAEVLGVIEAEFSRIALEKGLRFKLFFPLNGMVFYSDPNLLLSILRNLVDNAIKYTELGGVLIGIRRRGRMGLIQVWDTGIGIEPEFAERVFEECFQVGNPLRDRAKGLGLGLSIVRRTARLLGGEVTLRSRPGWGSVFELSLPLVESAVDLPLLESLPINRPVDEAGLPSLAGKRVVVVEDDELVARSIQLALRTTGMVVTIYRNAEVALSGSEILEADFVVSDYSLPGMNGLQMLDALSGRLPRPLRAVLITGEVSAHTASAASIGRVVLFKPVDLQKLVDSMRELARS